MIDTVNLMNAAMAVSGIEERIDDLEGVTVSLAGRLPLPGLRIDIACATYSNFLDVCDRLFDWAAIDLLVDDESAAGQAHHTRIGVHIAEEVAA